MHAQLVAACCGDEEIAAEIADVLTPEQRAGLSALPDPLPLVPGIRAVVGAALSRSDLRILLIAAVCVDDRVDVLLEAGGTTMTGLMDSAAGSVLSLVAGRFWYADPRVRIYVHESADLAARTAVHRTLQAVYEARGEAERALWHRALGCMQGDGALARPLLRLSAQALDAGQADRAYAIAREAASHADAPDVDAARIAAGRAALSGGWLDDAVAWLTPVMAGAHPDASAAQALSIATMLRYGAAPSAIEDERDAADRDLLAGHWAGIDASIPEDIDPNAAPLRAALRAALGGDVTEGLRILAVVTAPPHATAQSASHGVAHGPLLRAHREVLAALLRTWHGELGEARAALERAASAVPLALPFCGLAIRLARRLELACDGRSGELSAALEAVSPLPRMQARPVERAIAAYLSGRSDEASVHLGIWAERTARGIDIGLPGLDEVGPLEVPVQVQPPDAAHAGALRRQIRAVGVGAAGAALDDIAEEARSIRSPFERGRIEALLGIVALTRGEAAAATRHLRASIGMLADAGADAWRCAVEARLVKLGELPVIDVRTPTTPIQICATDPLGVCRSAWQPMLTARELEIAMLIAEGASNRDIAERLHLSVRTIEVHAGRVFRKFDVRTRGELTALAHRTNQHG
ncbi:LuxR family transcriptional regulator [Microbacterium bovistercoris]|uniref:LuxR family transcriptional regulator n=1 Tax=Microbacterium bovistercoris TaxID=2293570 RepID=A0A371NX77_9MICO|nr:LuxR family transcriptional regulator [Microbacterium bovistercoris]